MAAFGVPVPHATDAEIQRDAINAVQCALAMEQRLIQLNQRWQAQDLPVIGMRIGIYTGSVVAGSLGSTDRMEYTVHGDTVNTAERLESFAKHRFAPDPFNRPCRILIGEATLGYLDDRFQMNKMGQVRLRGKNRKVVIYRVLGHKEGRSSLQTNLNI
jgi:adenylate cyclase